MLKPWKHLFKTYILERGQDYYERGAVCWLKRNGAGYTAAVEGSCDYEVEVEIYDEEVVEMFCDCPYAESGNYCKHMAAVLYEIEEAEKTDSKILLEQPEKELSELEKIVKSLSENEAKDLLLNFALENKSLQNQIVSQYSTEISPARIKYLKKEIDEIGYRYSDRSGYIDYHHVMDYADELIQFLNDNVWNLIGRNHLAQAFDLTNAVFCSIGEQDMDDSDGGLAEVVYECYEYWKSILVKCNENERHQMFQWFMEHREDYALDFMQDYMTDFIMEEFHEPEILQQKLQLIDEEIAKAGDDVLCGEWYSAHYGFENNIVKRIQIMRELKCSEYEINEYKKKYWQFSTIRKMEVKDSLIRNDYDRAIEILKESKELDCKHPGLVSAHSSQLIELYRKIGKMEDYKTELKNHIFTYLQYDLANVYRMKDLCDKEEWQELREEFLKSKTAYAVKYPLLEAEKLYERLLKEVVSEDSIFLLDRYENTLKKQFPEAVRDWYVGYVRKRVESASDRNAYKGLMVHMKRIVTYPGGKKIAEEVAGEWREKYRRRPAMMDELKKAGF